MTKLPEMEVTGAAVLFVNDSETPTTYRLDQPGTGAINMPDRDRAIVIALLRLALDRFSAEDR